MTTTIRTTIRQRPPQQIRPQVPQQISSPQQFQPRSPCYFRQGNHLNDECHNFKTVQARKNRLTQLGHCTKCLKLGHFGNNCTSQMWPCSHCSQTNHSKALCYQFLQGINNNMGNRGNINSGNSGVTYNNLTYTSPAIENDVSFNNVPPADSHGLSYSQASPHERDFPLVNPQNVPVLPVPTNSPMQTMDSNNQLPSDLSHNYSCNNVELVCFNSGCKLCPTSTHLSSSNINSTLLIATAHIRHPTSQSFHKVKIFLDCGSQKSYISAPLVEKMSLSKEDEHVLLIHTFAREKPQQVVSNLVPVQLVTNSGNLLQLSVNSVPFLTGLIKRDPLDNADLDFLRQIPPSHLANALPTVTDEFQPDILLGLDYFFQILMPEAKQLLPSGLLIIPSYFGYLIGGNSAVNQVLISESSISSFPALSCRTEMLNSVKELNLFSSADRPIQQITPNFEDFFALDQIGITDIPDTHDDEQAMEIFEKGLKFYDSRYHTIWPFNPNIVHLPTNKKSALGRFKGLAKRLSADAPLFDAMDTVIRDQEKKGIIETITDSPNEHLDHPVHYLPFHPVITPGKTTRCRIVYDASAKENKTKISLNECMYRGPVILSDLCGLLIRFLLFSVALIADVEKAFLQISLQEQARDVTRFFWFKNPQNPLFDPSNIQLKRFCRLPFGAKSSPFILASTIDHHCTKINTAVSQKIKNNMYVDNLVTGVNSFEEAQRFYTEGKDIFQQASMNLREWTSNNANFVEQIDPKDRITTEVAKVLGIKWYKLSDELSICTCDLRSMQNAKTKRQIQRAVASIFDPLGFFNPIIVGAKLFLQKVWKSLVDWDTQIPQELITTWQELFPDLSRISEYRIPRFLGLSINNLSTNHLLCFCDSSTSAYSTNIYLRQCSKDEKTVTSRLLISKTRLAPAKGLSIPRLELLAVLIGCRLLQFVSSQLHLPLQDSYLWSDSSCVLNWIKSDKSLPIFVQNRLKEIRNYDSIHFRFIPGEQNPADLSTRKRNWTEFIEHKTWWQGPKWTLLT